MQEGPTSYDSIYFESSRGGANINFGTDKIMGQQPLIMHKEDIHVSNFLNNRGIHHLAQISSWDPHSHVWIGWSFPEILNALEPSLSYLKTLLQSKAPIKEDETDGFCWDSTRTNYTVRAGHQHLCNNTF